MPATFLAALLAIPEHLFAAPESWWEPVNASLSSLLIDMKYLIEGLVQSTSFQVLLIGVVLIGALIWGIHGLEEKSEEMKPERSGKHLSTRVRRNVIRHYFAARRRATL